METIDLLIRIGRWMVPGIVIGWQFVKLRLLRRDLARYKRLFEHSDQLAAGLGRIVVGAVGILAILAISRTSRREQKAEISQAKSERKVASNFNSALNKFDRPANDCLKKPSPNTDQNG